jgi:adenylate kinase family enzyme
MKIHILGASCAGSTTLGLKLAELYGIKYFDSDDFFWEKTVIPYTDRREPGERNRLFLDAVGSLQSWILGGSVINWSLQIEFDLIIFLQIPKEIRIARLTEREYQRFGDAIYTDQKRNEQFLAFVKWASGYDDNTARGRNFEAHKAWLKTQHCHILELTGDLTVEQRVAGVSGVLAKGGLKMENLTDSGD